MKHVFVALTGASGSVYGLRLAEQLCLNGVAVTFCTSLSGCEVCREETGLDLSGDLKGARERLCTHLEIDGEGLELVHPEDLFCAAASGSAAPDAMVVAPCSMGTLGRLAAGMSTNLIERAGDVMLKEGRPLVLVPRETPLSRIHLENMLRLSSAGARIVPAMPGFYHNPRSVMEMVDFMVGKVLDQLGIEHELFRRWGDKP